MFLAKYSWYDLAIPAAAIYEVIHSDNTLLPQ